MTNQANVIDLATLKTPEQLIEAATEFVKPIEVSQTVDVQAVENIRDEIAEMARISESGLFPETDPAKWTVEQIEQAEELISRLKQRTKAADVTRKTETDPLEQAKKRIIARWRALVKFHVSALDRVTREWQAARRAIQQREAEERRLAEERAEKERLKLAQQAEEAEEKGRLARADNLRDRAASVQAQAPAAHSETKPSAINTREEWDFVIVDKTKLPPQFLIPDEVGIRKAVKAMKDRAESMFNGAIKVTKRDVPVAKRS